jgi:hypothetical protein
LPFLRRLSWRVLLFEAVILLTAARLLVRLAGFKVWRPTLGRIVPPEPNRAQSAAPTTIHPVPPEPGTRCARRVALAVERAACLLPFPTKCLPRAVAVQWMLGLRGVPSTLAIAAHATDRTGEHAFHAWVERQGHFVIGHCDRAAYRALLRLSRGEV